MAISVGLLLALVLAYSAVWAERPGAAVVLLEYDETSIKPETIKFQRGVFRIDETGQRVLPLCIPFKGAWREVGTMRDCGNPPPPRRDPPTRP
jgi:hypothetical protein